MLKLVALDIDGVITDGKVSVDCNGEERKILDFRDIDAIFRLKRMGLKIALVTGEKGKLAEFFKRRFEADYFFSGAKDKRRCLEEVAAREGLTADEICYVGDAERDIEAIRFAGLGVCPQNAPAAVKDAADRVLTLHGGAGALMELVAMIEDEAKPTGFARVLEEHTRLIRAIASNPALREEIENAAFLIEGTIRAGNKILVCGNGGSAADSQHIVAELVGKFYHRRRALPAVALTTNTSTLTAIGNDFSFEEIFSRQVEAIGEPGDVLWGISTSGKSPNVLEAMRAANAKGMRTLFLTGAATDTVPCDVRIAVPSMITPRIQEAHILIGHYICEYAEREVTQVPEFSIAGRLRAPLVRTAVDSTV